MRHPRQRRTEVNEANRSTACEDGSCGCQPTALDRREILKLGALSAAVAAGLAGAVGETRNPNHGCAAVAVA